MMDINKFKYGGARDAGKGRAGALYDQKNVKITRTVPIIESNST